MRTPTRALVTALLVVVLTGCTTFAPKTARSEFEDIPVPKGLAYVESDSTIIESPTVKAAKLVYRGRVEPVSLGNAMRSTLETNGWRHVSIGDRRRQGHHAGLREVGPVAAGAALGRLVLHLRRADGESCDEPSDGGEVAAGQMSPG